MPSFCSVVNCAARYERDRVSFFRFPAVLTNRGDKLNALSVERREAWIKALKRGPLSETQLNNGRVCSRHFLTGNRRYRNVLGYPVNWPCFLKMASVG